MTTPRRALAGLGSLLVLATLLVGVPVALAIAVGWPLPHSWPTTAQIRTLLETSGIPDIVLIDVLAVVCWIAWLDFVLAAAVEVAAAIRGRSASRPLLARPWQAVAARLVTSIVVAVAIFGTRPTDGHAPRGTALSAALVSNGSVAAGTTLRVPPSSSTARPEMDSTAASAPPYVVRGGDTLWGIAGERLGDSRRWPDIWHHNEDRAEPGDRHLADPDLILPGWKLDLPATSAAAAGTGAASLPPAPAPAPSPPRQTQSRPPVDGGIAPPPAPDPAAASPVVRPTARPSPTDYPASGVRSGTSAVELPSGGLVSAGFAAGIVAGLAVARLHERRGRRVGSAVGSVVDRLTTPTVRHLRRTMTPRDSEGDGETDAAPAATAPEVETMVGPGSGSIPAGVTGDADRLAILDVLEVSGQSLTGPGADGVGRALASATLATPPLDTTGLIVVGGARRHLCGVHRIPGVEAIDEMPRAVARLEAECARRERVLRWRDGADQRALGPSPDPMATLLAIVDGPDIGGSQESLRAVIERGLPVGVAVAIVGTAPGFDVLPVAADGSTLPTASTAVADRFFSVSETEGAELLAVASAARGGVVAGVDVSPEPGAAVGEGDPAPHGEEATAGLHRVELLLFGPPRVVAEGTEVTTGLRGAARELLCLLAVHRAGLRQEEALTAMWPDDEDDRVGTLRVAITSTRRRLRELCGDDGQFVVLMGNRYVLEPDVVASDLWRFESALAGASRASDSASRIEHLGAAAEAVTGEPLAGAAYEWVEPIRESIRRRAVDALGELAALRGAQGDLAGAVEALERARIVDPYCEDVYRRLMRHLGECGRDDVAVRVYHELERYMATLGAQPDDATEDLMETLRARRTISPVAPPPERRGVIPKDQDNDDEEVDNETVTAARRTVVGRRDLDGGRRPDLATASTPQELPILDRETSA